MRSWPQRRKIRRLYILFACVLLCWIGGSHANASAQTNARWSQHITQAALLMQQTPSGLPASMPETIAPNGPPGSWRMVILPYISTTRATGLRSDAAKSTVTSWFRLVFKPPARFQDNTLFIYLPRWQTIGRVALYMNGQKIWQSYGDPVWNGFNEPVWVRLPANPSNHAFVVLLRMDSISGLGGGITSAWVGTRNSLIWRYDLRKLLQNDLPEALTIVTLTLGLFVLVIWFVCRDNLLYPLFTILALLTSIRNIHYFRPLNPHIMSSAWFGWMTISSMIWLVVVGLIFNCWFIPGKLVLMKRLLLAVAMICTILTMPAWTSSSRLIFLSTYVYLLCICLLFICLPVIISAAWRQRAWAGMMQIGWNVAMVPVGIHDLAMADLRISLAGIYWLPYAQLGWILSSMYIVCRQYHEAFNAAEHLNLSLEKRLQAREQELRTMYERLREVEQRNLLANERQRLMRDLHDGLGSMLIRAVRIAEHEVSQTNLEIVETLRNCLLDLKLTVDSLEPVEGDLSLILASFRHRVEPSLQTCGIKLQWAVTELPDLPWLTPTSALHILHILQEVLANIIVHAQASHICISTRVERHNIIICISDNGSGFTPAATAQHNGHGLKNIQQRAALISAQIRWDARAGGTDFLLSLPIIVGF